MTLRRTQRPAEHGGDHSGAAAHADELDIKSLGSEISRFLGDPGRRPTRGETRV